MVTNECLHQQNAVWHESGAVQPADWSAAAEPARAHALRGVLQPPLPAAAENYLHQQ